VLEFLRLAVIVVLAFIFLGGRTKIISRESKGCLIPLLLIALGAMFLRRELLYFRSDKPPVSIFPFIMGGIFIVGYIVYRFLSGDEEIKKIRDKIKTFFK